MSVMYTVHVQWNLSIKDILGLPLYVLILEVSSIQRLFYTLQYYTGTQNSVLDIEVFLIQRFVLESYHCNCLETKWPGT